MWSVTWLLRVTLVIVVLLLLLLDIGPTAADSRLYQTLWDFGHPLAFGLLAALLPRRCLFKGGLALVCLAAVVEVVQGWTGRTPSLHDVLTSGAGTAVVVAWRSGHRMLVMTALAALALATGPLWRNLADEWMMRREFPELISPDSPWAASRWRRPLEKVSGPDGRVAWVTRLEKRYNGAWLRHLYPDWRGYRALEIRLILDQPVSLTLRIDDRQHWDNGQPVTDRLNLTWALAAGEHRLQVPLNEVAQAPQGRLMDLSRIQSVYLFVPAAPQKPARLRILALRLIK